MNIKNLTYLLQNPTDINAPKTHQLNEIINEYPYFQSARAIHLKGLNKTNSFKYNQALKKTAAYTVDRKVLFEFITAQDFTINSEIKINKAVETAAPETTEITQKQTVASFSDQNIETEETSEISTDSTTIKDEDHKPNKQASEILEIGKPIQFNSSEPHSFNEWMQLISQKPIEREKKPEESIEKPTKIEEKFQLIDRFIESKPKIKPIDKSTVNQNIILERDTESESLMTETLAKVYLEQQKFESAIKAYRILSLKYPEKSGFFADRIKAVKQLQEQNN